MALRNPRSDAGSLGKEGKTVTIMNKSKVCTAAEKTGCIPKATAILLRHKMGKKRKGKKKIPYAPIFTARLLSEPHFCKTLQQKAAEVPNT